MVKFIRKNRLKETISSQYSSSIVDKPIKAKDVMKAGSRFPSSGVRRVPFGMRAINSIRE